MGRDERCRIPGIQGRIERTDSGRKARARSGQYDRDAHAEFPVGGEKPQRKGTARSALQRDAERGDVPSGEHQLPGGPPREPGGGPEIRKRQGGRQTADPGSLSQALRSVAGASWKYPGGAGPLSRPPFAYGRGSDRAAAMARLGEAGLGEVS